MAPSAALRASLAKALALAASPASHSAVLRMSWAVASSGFSAGVQASRSSGRRAPALRRSCRRQRPPDRRARRRSGARLPAPRPRGREARRARPARAWESRGDTLRSPAPARRPHRWRPRGAAAPSAAQAKTRQARSQSAAVEDKRRGKRDAPAGHERSDTLPHGGHISPFGALRRRLRNAAVGAGGGSHGRQSAECRMTRVAIRGRLARGSREANAPTPSRQGNRGIQAIRVPM